MGKPTQPRKFIFKNTQSIGAAAAEHDTIYRSECFVETENLEILRNCKDPKCLLVGRTGAGKSALLARLAEVEEHTIVLKPEALALDFISNSTVMKYYAELGVRFDSFFRLLWKHVFCVELLQERFDKKDDFQRQTFMEQLRQLIPKGRKHQAAMKYLEKHEHSFWITTEQNLSDVARTLSADLEAAVKSTVGTTELSLTGARNLKQEEKIEVVNKGQSIVNSAQIRDLSNLFDALAEVYINDPGQKYFITLDQLDMDWVEDDLKLRLIRALIHTAIEFTTAIPSVKIIVALRRDLIDRVFEPPRDAGMQAEKINSCILDLRWSRKDLIEVLDRRINVLVRDQYTKQPLVHDELLPKHMEKSKERGIDFLLDRTLGRPRDVIVYFNECINQSDGKAQITATALRAAEGVYSKKRLEALEDEWRDTYPNIFMQATILRKRSYPFAISDISKEEIDDLILRIWQQNSSKKNLDQDYLSEVAETEEWNVYRNKLVRLLYKVGIVGLKTEGYLATSWSTDGTSISDAEISPETRVFVHKAFWRYLGINARESQQVTE